MSKSLSWAGDQIRRPFVLDDPDLFLVELRLESFFFGLPEAEIAAGVSNLIDPMFVEDHLARRTQPDPFRLALARLAAEAADQAGMEGTVVFVAKGSPSVVALGKQKLSDERHRLPGSTRYE